MFPYALHEVEDDDLNTNGISEILWLTDDRLLIMERAYIPGKGNIVRLFETRLQNSEIEDGSALECSELPHTPLSSQLVFDFVTVNDFAIDNAEGMTFNADRSQLIVITDNNFSARQETKLISLP